MAKVDLWHARLGLKTLRRDQREAIAEAGEDHVTRPTDQRRPAPPGLFLGAAGQTICYHVHGGSYCHMGGAHELPSKQMDYVGRSGGHRPGCGRLMVRLAEQLAGRLAGRRDATSTVKHYLVLPGRLHPT